MTEHSRFFDSLNPLEPDRTYTAEEFTSYFRALITTGIMKGAANMLKVETSGSDMNTTVDTGTAFLIGRQYENDSKLSLTHEVEALGKSRIDRVVLRLVLDMDARYIRAFVKKGAAGTSPIPPPLTREGNVYEISLAQVKVIGGQTYINAADVTDERGIPDVCPWAGSKILPNFDDEALEDLVDKVDNMYSLTDGPTAMPYSGDLNNLVESGLYSVPTGTLNTPTNAQFLIEVQVSSDGKMVVQKATIETTNSITVPTLVRRGIKNAQGVTEWAKPTSGESGMIGGWRIFDPVLNNTLNSTSTTEAATANAVKSVSDRIGGINGETNTQTSIIMFGYGPPEGSLPAKVGTLYVARQGGANTTLYVKTSGTGNTGWTAK